MDAGDIVMGAILTQHYGQTGMLVYFFSKQLDSTNM